MVSATVRVSSVQVDPQLRDHRHRWLVTADVVTVHEGELPDAELTVLLHSPSRDLQDPDPVGHLFRVRLADGGQNPHVGLLDATPA